MAIQKRFIHFKKFSDFNSKKLSANEANTQYTIGVSGEVQTGAPDILYQSYCWIKDTKQQWTHGQLYDCNPNDDASSSVYITPFTLNDIERTYRGEITSIQWDYQAMMNAIHDNAVILIPYGSELSGYSMVGACYYEDRIYFTISTIEGGTEYAIDAGIGNESISTSDIIYFDVRGKQDTLVSGTNIKTINGESILGSGNIATNDREYKITKSEGQTVNLIEGYKWMVTNLLNVRLVIIMPSNPTSDNYTKECGITFTTGSTAPTIIFSGNIWWVNGTAPTIDANSAYEFSFKFNFANNMWLGVYASFKTV